MEVGSFTRIGAYRLRMVIMRKRLLEHRPAIAHRRQHGGKGCALLRDALNIFFEIDLCLLIIIHNDLGTLAAVSTALHERLGASGLFSKLCYFVGRHFSDSIPKNEVE